MEVDDKIQTHQLYKDLIATGIAYGAERWIMELQRIGERFACFYVERIPIQDSGGGHTSFVIINIHSEILTLVHLYIYLMIHHHILIANSIFCYSLFSDQFS